MWDDQSFSQRNRETERTLVIGVGGDREVRQGGRQNLKKEESEGR